MNGRGEGSEARSLHILREGGAVGRIRPPGKLGWGHFPNRSPCAGEEATGLLGVGVSVLKGHERGGQSQDLRVLFLRNRVDGCHSPCKQR